MESLDRLLEIAMDISHLDAGQPPAQAFVYCHRARQIAHTYSAVHNVDQALTGECRTRSQALSEAECSLIMARASRR